MFFINTDICNGSIGVIVSTNDDGSIKVALQLKKEFSPIPSISMVNTEFANNIH